MDSELRGIMNSGVKRIFREMIFATQRCLDNTPNRTFEKDLKCETAMFSDNNAYTYHTHPNGNPEPSDIDRKTTKKFGKKYLIIGLVPQREIVFYSTRDNFRRMIGKINV